jgi:histidyl-tRNA synthetase
MRRFRRIETVFRDCLQGAGYEEIRTPTVEYLHLFTMAGTLTPGRLNRVYSFLDWDGWSGERVVLKPDGTIPVARYCVENCTDISPVKLFYITNIFIFEETGNEPREQWQGGAELVGVGSPLADVELITQALEVINRLGFPDTELRLSHVGLVRTLLAELGLTAGEQTAIFDRIMDGDTGALSGLKPVRPELKRALSALLDLKGNSPGFLQNCKALFQMDLPQLEPHIDDLIAVVSHLDTLGVEYQIDVTSGAGFEYYTGMAFQLFLGGEQVGGGGRYDALMPLVGGGPVPASGFALYLDRLMDRLVPLAVDESGRRILVTFDPGDPDALRKGFTLAGDLRRAGFTTEVDTGVKRDNRYGWMVAVRKDAPVFLLTDAINRQEFELNTAGDVITRLEEQSADQAGSA